jgi:SAM-dependent methyltransferase
MSFDRLEYGALNLPVLSAVPQFARKVLDIGCGTGSLGGAIRSRQPAEVIGVTYSESEAQKARQLLDRVVVTELNGFDPHSLGEFDCVVCSHVLEHLYWPAELLRALRPCLVPGGRLVVALPNVLAWRQRLRFLFGRFRYTDGGLMDWTHFRFFDWRSAQDLVTEGGYRVVGATADGVFPLARFVPGIGELVSRAAVGTFPGLFGWQFIILAEPACEERA